MKKHTKRHLLRLYAEILFHVNHFRTHSMHLNARGRWILRTVAVVLMFAGIQAAKTASGITQDHFDALGLGVAIGTLLVTAGLTALTHNPGLDGRLRQAISSFASRVGRFPFNTNRTH